MRIATEHIVGVSEIAERCGTGTSAVSNWIKRADLGFPQPVLELRAGKFFDWRQVKTWLVATDREFKDVA